MGKISENITPGKKESLNLLGGKVEPREYEIIIFREAAEMNTLIVLPTGLGKTIIAAMVAENVLLNRREKVLFLAPTRPLVAQHYDTFRKLLDLKDSEISKFTGEVDNEDRLLRWATCRAVIATPQVVLNDLRNGLFDISRFGLMVFDEAHRATGNYAYVDIARHFLDSRKRLILGMTASPGAGRERLDEVTQALGIESIIIKSENDPDVRNYVGGIDIELVRMALPPYIRNLSTLLRKVLNRIADRLRNAGIVSSPNFSRSDVASKMGDVISRARSGEANLFGIIPYMTAAIRIDYALEYLESQGLEIASEYIQEILESQEKTLKRTTSILSKMQDFQEFSEKLQEEIREGHENPKMVTALRLSEDQVSSNRESRIIIFTHFRKTSELLVAYLSSHSGVLRPVRFVGQSSRGSDEGISQKEQEAILQKFRENEFNVLVATSVAEEGLDIPSTDLVIFFEPVPSEIRSIQRRGRTGRTHAGAVKILMYEGTRDSGYYYSSLRRESRMKRNIERISDSPGRPKPMKKTKEPSLDDFLS